MRRFRAAFADFEPERVARFGKRDVNRLLGDAGIVRNRAKIEATIANARATAGLIEAGESLALIAWSHAPKGRRAAPKALGGVPALTSESTALSKDLKQRGFRFIRFGIRVTPRTARIRRFITWRFSAGAVVVVMLNPDGLHEAELLLRAGRADCGSVRDLALGSRLGIMTAVGGFNRLAVARGRPRRVRAVAGARGHSILGATSGIATSAGAE